MKERIRTASRLVIKSVVIGAIGVIAIALAKFIGYAAIGAYWVIAHGATFEESHNPQMLAGYWFLVVLFVASVKGLWWWIKWAFAEGGKKEMA